MRLTQKDFSKVPERIATFKAAWRKALPRMLNEDIFYKWAVMSLDKPNGIKTVLEAIHFAEDHYEHRWNSTTNQRNGSLVDAVEMALGYLAQHDMALNEPFWKFFKDGESWTIAETDAFAAACNEKTPQGALRRKWVGTFPVEVDIPEAQLTAWLRSFSVDAIQDAIRKAGRKFCELRGWMSDAYIAAYIGKVLKNAEAAG